METPTRKHVQTDHIICYIWMTQPQPQLQEYEVCLPESCAQSLIKRVTVASHPWLGFLMGDAYLVQSVPTMQVAIGIWRPIMERVGLPRVLSRQPLIYLLLCPVPLQLWLPLLAISPHVELCLWQVDSVLVWACKELQLMERNC